MADDTRTDWVRWLAAGLLLSAVAFFIAQAATVSLPELKKAEQNWDKIHLLAITGVLQPALFTALAVAALGFGSPGSRGLLRVAQAIGLVLFLLGLEGFIQVLVMPEWAPRFVGGDNKLVEALHILPGLVMAAAAWGAARRLRSPRAKKEKYVPQPTPWPPPPREAQHA